MKSTKNLILMSIGIMAFTIFCFEAVFSIYTQQRESLLLKESLLVNTVVKEANNLDHKISSVSKDAEALALLIGNDTELEPLVYDNLIRDIISQENLAFGMGYWFEPYYFDPDLKYYGPYIYKKSNNNIVETMAYSTVEYDYINQAWYNNSIVSDKTTVYSTPFYDEYLDTVFMTAAVKIISKETQVGVVSIDITLREVNKYLGRISHNYNASSFIVTEDAYIWGNSPDLDLDINDNILEIDNAELKELSETLLKGGNSSSITLDENIYVWSNIGDSGLILTMAYPKVNVMNPIFKKGILHLTYFVIAMLVFMLFLNFILVRRIEKPLVNLINQNLSSNQDENLEISVLLNYAPNFDNMVNLIRNLLTEKQEYIHKLNSSNSKLISKNDEIEALYNQTDAMNKKLYHLLDEVKNGYIVTVRSLSSAIEAKDKYTKGHCENVTSYSLQIAKTLGLPDEDLTVLEYAALLHDIGKIGIPSSILNKPGKLTDEEFEVIKSHPAIGYEILKDIDFLKRSALIVFQHHERIDGKGYPRGLTNDELDNLTKIITVADAYDAMTSARPYRTNPLSHEKAMAILEEGGGTQFSSPVIEALKTVLNQ